MIDVVKIKVKAGDGGKGAVAWRHEKYYPNGGPFGGDGGRGGNVYIQVDTNETTLMKLRYTKRVNAGNGGNGMTKKMHGKDGDDVTIRVPLGTMVRNAANGDLMADLTKPHQIALIARGGKGGLGNQHFATSTMQAPKYAQPGQPSLELETIFELKIVADVGLVGFPNAGKSSLLAACTNARPKIAGYQFTTLQPNLGVVDLGGGGFVISDIPGLIEGASDGLGLGHEFLRHVERTKVLIHVVDAAGTEGRDPVEDIRLINSELEKYNPDLLKKPQIIAANKSDLFASYEGAEDNIRALKDAFEPEGLKVYTISAATGDGIKELLRAASDLLKTLPEEQIVFEQEYDPEINLKITEDPYTVYFDDEEDEYVIEGPRIEKMLGYTNLDSEKGFAFFQKFLKDNGMLEQLEDLGIKDGDTVRLYGHSFEYYK